MRVLFLEAPPDLIETRHHLGLDVFDEMWEGVLHMVPAPSNEHQEFDAQLILKLGPRAEARGLRISPNTALYLADDDYKIPDLAITQACYRTKRGIEGGADFIVEILSPGDESYDKLPFYERFGVTEALYVNPTTRRFDFFVRRGKRLRKKTPDKDGLVRSAVLGVTFATRRARLEIGWKGGSTKI